VRPAGEVLRKGDYYVDSIPVGMGVDLVEAYHYTGRSARQVKYRHGLFTHDNPLDCLGAALWMPSVPKVVQDWHGALTLTRLVVEPGMPTNTASFLLAASIKMIRREGKYRVLVTYADEAQGHTGSIYRATNWEYVGSKFGSTSTFLDVDGNPFSWRGVTQSNPERISTFTKVPNSPKHKFVMYLDPKSRPTGDAAA
jgi:hypothetical protein